MLILSLLNNMGGMGFVSARFRASNFGVGGKDPQIFGIGGAGQKVAWMEILVYFQMSCYLIILCGKYCAFYRI